MSNGTLVESTDLLAGVEPGSPAWRCSAQMEAFIRDQQGPLLAFMRNRVATPEDAEEAAQDCFLRLLRYQDRKPAFTWRFLLYRIAANIAADRARRSRTQRTSEHVPLDGLAIASGAPSQERQLAGQQELALLRAAILALPPRCRQVFLLNRVHGMTYAQIARHLGISVKAVEKQIHKAVARCETQVGRGGVGDGAPSRAARSP